MNRREIEEVLSYGAGAYPAMFTRLRTDEVAMMLKVWSEAFADDRAEEVWQAYRRLVQTCHFPPCVAEVRSEIERIRRGRKYRLAGLA